MTRIQEYLFVLIFVLLPVFLTGSMIFFLLALGEQFPWYVPVGGIGFSLVTGSWFTIYLRVRRELPDHPLAKASYFPPPLRDWFVGTRLVTFYVRHYGLDLRSWVLLIGLAMLIITAVGQNVQAIRTIMSPAIKKGERWSPLLRPSPLNPYKDGPLNCVGTVPDQDQDEEKVLGVFSSTYRCPFQPKYRRCHFIFW